MTIVSLASVKAMKVCCSCQHRILKATLGVHPPQRISSEIETGIFFDIGRLYNLCNTQFLLKKNEDTGRMTDVTVYVFSHVWSSLCTYRDPSSFCVQE